MGAVDCRAGEVVGGVGGGVYQSWWYGVVVGALVDVRCLVVVVACVIVLYWLRVVVVTCGDVW